MAYRVLISDPLSGRGLDVLRACAELELDVATGLPAAELAGHVGEADAWIIRSGTKVTADLLGHAHRLRIIGRAGIGLDNVDLDAATRRGVVVMNTPTGNAVTTAEHTIALLMAAARRIPAAHRALREGRWERKKWIGTELTGKTLGVIGLGNIGRIVCARALGLRMRVVGHDPFASPDLADRLGIKLVDLPALLDQADALTVHVPLTAATRGLIGAKELARTRPGLIVVNCARGGIVDEAALADALESGHVAAAAVDVYSTEPPPTDHPLLQHDNVVTTPHLGASTGEAQEAVAVGIAEQVRDYLLDGVIRHAVNVPSVTGEALERLRPFLRLAGRMGSLAAQLFDHATVDQVHITFAGDITHLGTDPLEGSLLAGLLRSFAGDVNIVNAPVVARERGLDVAVTRKERSADFASLVTLEITGPAGSLTVAGTTFGQDDPRIVRIDRFLLEVVPEGHLLVHTNTDRPGVIGAVGTLLGDRGINVSRLQVGLDRDRGEAMALWNVDGELDDALFAQVGQVAGMQSVRRVRL